MAEKYTYFENKDFVKWALGSEKESDKLWNEFIEQNQSEKKDVESARLIISQFASQENNFESESLDLYTGLLKKINKKNKNSATKKLVFALLRYAAVAIIFLIIGVALFYESEQKRTQEINQRLAELNEQQNTSRLILADGRNIPLIEKESNILYKDDGKIIINKKDTINTNTENLKVKLDKMVVPYGENNMIVLNDGTNAYLNAGSTLIYPSHFEGEIREVYLIGEGYFDVAHNPEKPFFVKTNDLTVEALGTKFNVAAYPVDETIEVVLVEGKVGIKESAFKLMKKEYILQSHEIASFNRKTHETSLKRVDVNQYVSWHQGYMNFESVDLSRIVIKLERYYNVKIQLSDPMMGLRRITGKLKLKEECDKVLNVLASTASSELVKINDRFYVLK